MCGLQRFFVENLFCKKKIEHNNACIMRFYHVLLFTPHSYLNRIYKCQGHDDISSITALVSSVSVTKPTARVALMKNKLVLLSTSVIMPCGENEVTFMSFFFLCCSSATWPCSFFMLSFTTPMLDIVSINNK